MNYAKALFLPLVMAATLAPEDADAQPMSECFVVQRDGVTLEQCGHTPGQYRTSDLPTASFVFTNNTSAAITVGVWRVDAPPYSNRYGEALEWTLQPGSALQWSDAHSLGGVFPWLVWCPGGYLPVAGRDPAGHVGWDCVAPRN